MKRKIPIAIIASILCLYSALAMAGKQEARDFWTGASVLGGAGVLTPEPLTTAAGTGALVGQGVGYIGMGLWDFFAAAPSKPDPNHGVLASVTPVHFTPVSGSGQGFDNINTSLSIAGEMIDNSRLLSVSLQRYYGALADGHAANASYQQQAASQYLFELEANIFDYRNILTDISTDISGSEFAMLSATKADVLALRDEILLSGFPGYEDFVFSEMNATSEEMSNALLEVAEVTGNYISDSDLKGDVFFDGLALAIGQIDIQELLPSSFSVVPEPSTFALLFIGLAGIACSRRVQRRESS